eukprot:5301864-Prymnesium_polylepis.1
MVTAPAQRGRRPSDVGQTRNVEDYWPPACERLNVTTISILSVHNLPKVHASTSPTHRSATLQPRLIKLVPTPQWGERRPRYDGARSTCHK